MELWNLTGLLSKLDNSCRLFFVLAVYAQVLKLNGNLLLLKWSKVKLLLSLILLMYFIEAIDFGGFKRAIHGLFYVYILSFSKKTLIQFLQKINVKKFHPV